MSSPSFISRIETEVLIKIFEIAVHTPCAPSQSYDLDSWQKWPKIKPGIASHVTGLLTPLTLSHVSKAWRELSFCLHDLWSTIYITNGAPCHVPQFQLWIQNSGDLPLDLLFRDTDDFNPGSCVAILDMLRIAVGHSSRWRSFKFRLSRLFESPLFQLDVDAMATMFQGISTPQLRSLAFSFGLTDDSEFDTFNALWKGLAQNSPALNEMLIWSTDDSLRSITCAFPYHRLTTLCLFCIFWYSDEVFRHLTECTALKELAISFANDYEDHPQDLEAQPIIQLQSLKRLTLVGGSALAPVIDQLTLPSLSSLTLHVDIPASDKDRLIRGPIAKMLSRSGSKLQIVSLADTIHDSADSWIPLFSHPSFQHVEELEVGCCAYGTLLDALAIYPPGRPSGDNALHADETSKRYQPPLPRLRRIHLLRYYTTLDSPSHSNSLTKMALSRTLAFPAVARLDFVSADFPSFHEIEAERNCWDGMPELANVEHSFLHHNVQPLQEPIVRDFSMFEDWLIVPQDSQQIDEEGEDS